MKDKLRALICRWLDWAYRCWGQEDRCGSCWDKQNCPGAGTGVAWPCPYYRKEDI